MNDQTRKEHLLSRLYGKRPDANKEMMDVLMEKNDWYTVYRGRRLTGTLEQIREQKKQLNEKS